MSYFGYSLACLVDISGIPWGICDGQDRVVQCGNTGFSSNPPANVECCCIDDTLTCAGYWFNAQTDITVDTIPILWHGTLDMACAASHINITIQGGSAPMQVWGAFCPCNQVLELAITNPALSTETETVYLVTQEQGNAFEGNLTLSDGVIDQLDTDCGYWCPEQPPCTVSRSQDGTALILNLVYESGRSQSDGRLCTPPWVWVLTTVCVVVPVCVVLLLCWLRKHKKKKDVAQERVEEMDEMTKAAALYK